MYIIEENKNQSICVTDRNGKKINFLPRSDLNKSLSLLKEFNNIKNKEGKKIFSIWKVNGIYIYPALQEWLFWNFFVGLVQNKELLNYLHNKKFKIKKNNYYTVSSFQRMHNVLNYKRPIIIKIIYNFLSFVLSKNKLFNGSFLLNDEGPFSFRFKKLKLILDKKYKFFKLERIVFDSLFSINNSIKKIFFGYLPLKSKEISHTFNLDNIILLDEYISKDQLTNLIESINYKCNEIEYQINNYLPILKQNKPNLLLTYDQIENALPIIACLRILDVKVLSFQHGPFSIYHAGWLAPGIDSEFCNLKPNKIIVWGQYWKNFLIKHSNKYNQNEIQVGPHLNKKISYEWPEEKSQNKSKDLKSLNILIPYEFLANNIEISEYLRVFPALGWKTVVKLRPEKKIDRETDKLSYDQDIRSKIEFREEISDQELLNFDAVVCTQTVFAVEMMRFNVPIWYLDTSVPFLKHIADNGIAHQLSLTEIQSFSLDIDKVKKYLKPKYSIKDYMAIFNNMKLDDYINSIEELNDQRA